MLLAKRPTVSALAGGGARSSRVPHSHHFGKMTGSPIEGSVRWHEAARSNQKRASGRNEHD